MPNLMHKLLLVMYFSYNGTRDWLKIEWHDQSCMNLEVVAKNKQQKFCHVLELSSCLQFTRNGTV